MNSAEGSADVPRRTSWLMRIWRGIKIFLVLFVILFVAGLIWRYPGYLEKERSAEVAQQIRDARLTMADADGSNLPPQPDPALVDATVEGIDANGNGIRDDVELAIFAKYPGVENLKLRAAELQYAKALQTVFLSFTKETLTASAWEQSRAYFCIDSISPKLPITASDEEWRAIDVVFKRRINEITDLVLNTAARSQRYEDAYDKYMSSHASPASNYCDVMAPSN